MKKIVKNIVISAVVAALSFAVAPAAQAATVTIEVDCTTMTRDNNHMVAAGDTIVLNLTNCDYTTPMGGTSWARFADYVSSTGDVTASGDANNWSVMIGAGGTASITLLVRGNRNESYTVDEPLTSGQLLFDILYRGSYYGFNAEVNQEEQPETSEKIGTVTFAADSAKLSKASKNKLRAIARNAKEAYASKIRVTGFTAKSSNSTWSEKERRALAKARAKAVTEFLEKWFDSKSWIIEIETVAMGSKQALKPNNSEKNRAKNRRVEISLLEVLD